MWQSWIAIDDSQISEHYHHVLLVDRMVHRRRRQFEFVVAVIVMPSSSWCAFPSSRQGWSASQLSSLDEAS